MAIEHYNFTVELHGTPSATSFTTSANGTIGNLIETLQGFTNDMDAKIDAFWKLGQSSEEGVQEHLNSQPQDQTLEGFVQARSDKFPSDRTEPFYLVVRKADVSKEESEKQKYNFDSSWLGMNRDDLAPPAASASSSVEANVDTSESLPSSSATWTGDGPSESADFRKRFDMRNGDLQPGPWSLSILEAASSRQTMGFQPAQRDTDDVFVGLVNQAMTCYLNSLLQTLFMTPEFRNALYNWEYTGTKEEQNRSIPYQLQKLFVLLQTSVNMKTALETKELTRSFGWDSSHAWDQHDVQELCRVMFDALELKWRRTNQATVITQLYQGTMKDYVKCLECSTENARNDVFLDLPLAIKPFGAQQAYRSIEEALRAFVHPEVLDGTNQYHCEKCQKKVNAHKGLKITKFPYLLTIQLKRFDFDYTTMHRIKLNDRMTFPDLLNLNPFVEVQEPVNGADEDQAKDRIDEDSHAGVAGESGMLDDEMRSGEQLHSSEAEKGVEAVVGHSGESDDEGICVDGTMGGGNSSAGSPIDADEDGENGDQTDHSLVNNSTDQHLIQELLKEGPYVYELFSIMVHSGSANGGHYYAYIKNLDTKVWYCFNDQVVTRASIEDIRKTYGGTSSSPFMYSSYGSSTNAYMLMYRQIDAERNLKLPSVNKLPEHIVRMIDKLRLEEEEQRLLEERQRSLMMVKIYFYCPDDGRLLEEEFEIPKRELVSSLIEISHEKFGLQRWDIPVSLCRLVRFSKHKEQLETSLDNSKSIHSEMPWTYSAAELLLETAPRTGWFRPYQIGGLTIKLYMVDLEAGRVRLPKKLLYATKDMTVQELKDRIGELFEWNPRRINLVLDHYTHNLRLLDVPNKTLSDEDMWGPATMFVEFTSEDVDAESGHELSVTTPDDFEKTRFYAILDQFKNAIRINVSLPSAKEYETLGYAPPYKINVAPPVMEDVDDVPMVSAKTSPCPPLPSIIPTSTSTSMVPSSRLALTIQQAEDCSTASGSTQYVTPATSRSPSPERGDSVMSPASQDDLTTAGANTPDLEVTMSGNATPSPQVSPDASPSGYGRNEPFVEERPPQETHVVYPLPFEFGRPVSDYQPPPPLFSFDNALSRIDVDLDSDARTTTDDDRMGSVAKDKTPTPPSEKIDYYFDVVTMQPSPDVNTGPVLSIEADKRMYLLDFIQKVAPHVGVSSDQFKLYKTYTSHEYECTVSASTTVDTLSTTNGFSELQLRIKLGRPLKEGESMVKFLRFELNDLEAYGKHLFDIALTQSSKIEDIKQECQTYLKRQCGLDVPTDRIRLRDSGTGFMDILHDGTVISSRNSYWSTDLYLQILDEPETATTLHHTAIFIRRWCPSTLSLGPMQEIVLPPKAQENPSEQYSLNRLCDIEFFMKVSQLSNIPLKRLQCTAASCEGTFPYECGKLKLLEEMPFHGLPAEVEQAHKSSLSTGCDMDSEGDGRKNPDDDGDSAQQAGCSNRVAGIDNPQSSLGHRGLQSGRPGYFHYQHNFWNGRGFVLPHDGVLVYYRDAQEQPKALNDDERKELQIRDNARLRKNQTSYSSRKERALKIYTEISSSVTDDLD